MAGPAPPLFFQITKKTLVPFLSLSLSQVTTLTRQQRLKRITQSLSLFWASRDSVTLNGEYWEDSTRMWSKYTSVLILEDKEPLEWS